MRKPFLVADSFRFLVQLKKHDLKKTLEPGRGALLWHAEQHCFQKKNNNQNGTRHPEKSEGIFGEQNTRVKNFAKDFFNHKSCSKV